MNIGINGAYNGQPNRTINPTERCPLASCVRLLEQDVIPSRRQMATQCTEFAHIADIWKVNIPTA